MIARRKASAYSDLPKSQKLDFPYNSGYLSKHQRPHTMRASTQLVAIVFLLTVSGSAWAQMSMEEKLARFKERSKQYESEELAVPYQGITTNGKIESGLFEIRSTGVSTEPVRAATNAFMETLSPEQLAKTTFPIDDDEWRMWMNQHFYVRQGVGFDEMNEGQREAAFAMLDAALSAKGLELTRDIMKLNHTLGELKDNNFVEYGEWLYWITIMGEPSETEPWGWQLDGHHVIINYFVLGDQVVMTPLFIGSEPVVAESGKYKGIAILQEEQEKGLSMLQSLDDEQRAKAILETSKEGNNTLSEAWKDNIDLSFAGVSAEEMTYDQREQLLALIGLYVNNMKEGHAKLRMEEVVKHLDRTYFAWIGGTGEQDVYYYRIHSPVILIEFDHQRPAGLGHMYPRDKPMRQHIHAVVRTPNGNDYGKDLLRQHLEQHPHK